MKNIILIAAFLMASLSSFCQSYCQEMCELEYTTDYNLASVAFLGAVSFSARKFVLCEEVTVGLGTNVCLIDYGLEAAFALATYTYAAYLFSNKKELCLSGCPVPPPAPPIFNGYYTPTYGGGYGGNIGSAWGNNFTPGGCDATIHVLTAYVQGMPVEWKDGCGNWHYF